VQAQNEAGIMFTEYAQNASTSAEAGAFTRLHGILAHPLFGSTINTLSGPRSS